MEKKLGPNEGMTGLILKIYLCIVWHKPFLSDQTVISFEEASSHWLNSSGKEDVENITFMVKSIFVTLFIL